MWNFLATWFVWGLTGYHTFLVMTGLTTNEELKKSYLVQTSDGREYLENPFATGSIYGNCSVKFCSPRLPSMIKYVRKLPDDQPTR